MARQVAAVLNVGVVDSTVLFLPGGDVYDWTRNRTKDVARSARALCPPGRSHRRATTRYVSTGRLRRSIRAKTSVDGTRLDVGKVSVGPVDQGGGNYVGHVIGGTAYQGMRYIYSDRGYPNKAIIDAVISRRGIMTLGLGRQVTAKDLQGNWVMRFRTDGGRHFRVHGQRGNPFLTDGYNVVAARHAALGFMGSPFL